MIASLVAAVCFQIEEAKSLRTILPNGAVIWCENRPAEHVSIQFFVSSRGTIDTEANYGQRHLLEHILIRDLPGQDRAIETLGGIVSASTTRDWIRFEWKLPPDQTKFAFDGIQKLVLTSEINPASIKRESRAIGEENSLRTDSDHESESAWSALYGASGLDAVGKEESLSKCTSEELVTLWQRLLRGNNVVISASGPIDLKVFTETATPLIAGIPAHKAPWAVRNSSAPATGNARSVAVEVGPLDQKSTVARLSAAFALAASLKGSSVTYTPSMRGGVVLVQSNSKTQKISQVLSELPADQAFALGKTYCRGWLAAKQRTADSSADFMGSLLCINPALKPAKIQESIDLASYSEFQKAWTLLKGAAK